MRNKHTIAGMMFLCAALMSGIAFRADAAPLNYQNAASLSLASPTTTLTIATSSLADALVVNATSVAVTLSQTTGGSFVILSPSYDLSVATSTGGGSVIISCSVGVDTATLSQSIGSTVYTVTPLGTTCASGSAPVISNILAANITTNSATITWTTNVAADSTVSYGTTTAYGATSTDPTLVTTHSISLLNLNSGTTYHFAVASAENGTSTISGDNTFTTTAVSSGGGGGGGGGGSVGVASGYGNPFVPGTSVIASSSPTSSTTLAGTSSTSSTSSLEAELNVLLAELATLQSQAGKSISTSLIPSSYVFTRSLYFGTEGNDVKELQLFLIQENVGPAAAKLAVHGATKIFGTLTENALIEFQKKVGIKPAVGFFGPVTRVYVNKLEK